MKRISLLLIVFAVLFEACSNSNTQKASVIAPEFLKSGDSIALVAPAYPVPDSMVKVCCGMLESFGLVPVIGPNAYKVHPADTMYHGAHYAGTPAERAADFKWAYEDRSIKGIISLTGGYGSIHVLPYISNELISNNPKWFVGCSDEFAYRSVESMIHDALKDLGIPVCFGFPAGHGKRNLPLVEGAMTSICVPSSDSAYVEQVVGL